MLMKFRPFHAISGIFRSWLTLGGIGYGCAYIVARMLLAASDATGREAVGGARHMLFVCLCASVGIT